MVGLNEFIIIGGRSRFQISLKHDSDSNILKDHFLATQLHPNMIEHLNT